MKRWLLVMGVVGASFVGLERIGVTPVVSHYDAHFRWRQDAARPARILLSTDTGDLDCWLRLVVQPLGDAPAITASITDGTELAVSPSRVAADKWSLEISSPGLLSTQRMKFKWPAGIEVAVTSTGAPTATVIVTDWEIFGDKAESDSAAKARQRRIWFWVSLVMLGLSLASGIYGVLPEKPATGSITAAQCIQLIIPRVEGSSKEETKRFQQFLQKVMIEGSKVDHALEEVGIRPHDRRVFFFRVRARFLERLSHLISELQRHHSLLK